MVGGNSNGQTATAGQLVSHAPPACSLLASLPFPIHRTLSSSALQALVSMAFCTRVGLVPAGTVGRQREQGQRGQWRSLLF